MSFHHVTAAALRIALIARMISHSFLRILVIASVFLLQLIALRVCARVNFGIGFLKVLLMYCIDLRHQSRGLEYVIAVFFGHSVPEHVEVIITKNNSFLVCSHNHHHFHRLMSSFEHRL